MTGNEDKRTCLTCRMLAEKKCFMCRNYDNPMYCSEVCGYSKRGFCTEMKKCPECGKEWEA